ncbi:MAG: DUF1837 domain-containing protein [Phycisphaerae bacterium]|nr:DUF1837 domain-containing protein [Phycisphaerae bacterium]
MTTRAPNPEHDDATPELCRDTYDLHWLTPGTPQPYTQLEHHPLSEIEGSREVIRDSLSRAIVDHHFHRRRIADRLAALGHTHVARFFREELPRNDRTRKGNFGEVVASEHVIQRYGYSMPVLKIRYRDSHNLPMRGEDIVAFELNAQQQIQRVIVGEAKAVVRYGRATVTQAHERLQKAYQPRPMTLSMIAEILYEVGNDQLEQQIDAVSDHLRSGHFPRDNWIFLINQRQPDDPFRCLEDDQDVVPNLHCANLSISALSEFVTDLFENPAHPEP